MQNPPKAFWRIRVRQESRQGTIVLDLPMEFPANAPTTWPKVERDFPIQEAYFNLSPVTPNLLNFSLPARSTK